MSAFVLSATLHGVVIAILLLLSYAASQQVNKAPRILELVAGGGDNFGARVAPKLGTPNGVKLDVPPAPPEIPKPPAPKAEVKPEPPPVPKKVETVAPTKPPETKAPDFKKQIAKQVNRAVTKAKAEVEKERKAEAKRLADEEKKKLAKMTKEEFDKLNKTKSVAKATPQKTPQVDYEGIAQGVKDGSVENKTGGAGGKALTADIDDVLAAWISLLKQRVKTNFEPPAGLSDTLELTVQFRANADGSLTDIRVIKSSGSSGFNNAVIDAFKRTRMPARPDGKTETFSLGFSMRELDER